MISTIGIIRTNEKKKRLFEWAEQKKKLRIFIVVEFGLVHVCLYRRTCVFVNDVEVLDPLIKCDFFFVVSTDVVFIFSSGIIALEIP